MIVQSEHDFSLIERDRDLPPEADDVFERWDLGDVAEVEEEVWGWGATK